MASVFLSYTREDVAKAKSIATALEKAGHQVWWDRHIHGGSEFAGAIQTALNSAQVVLVLWSRASVGSEWVRDEATEGRDSGRLLPVVLDDSKAPLGFRQRQSIDMSGWSGRGQPLNFDTLITAIAAMTGTGVGIAKPSDSARRWNSQPLLAGVLVAVFAGLLILGAWLYSSGKLSGPQTPTVAILPFADLSPEGDKAYFAEGVGEAILSKLASEPNIRVIGRSSTKQFQDNSSDIRSIGKALGVTHVLEGSARTDGDQLRLSVRLVNAANGNQLWAQDYNRRMSGVFAIQDEIGRAIVDRLRGTLAEPNRQAGRQVTGIDGYTLYLAARAKMRNRDERSLRDAMDLARQVIALDPGYAPGHAIYAELIELLANDPFAAARNPSYFFAGKDPRGYAHKLATAHAMRAIQLAPKSAEGYAALGLFAKRPEDAVAPLRRAIALDPSRTELRLWLGNAYGRLGRRTEAYEQVQAAAEMDPLWHVAIRRLAWVHASSGRYTDADAVVDGFLKRGGNPAQTALIRAMLARMRGNLHEALKQTQLAYRHDPNSEVATLLVILYQPAWLNRPDRAAELVVVKGSELFPRLVRSGQNQAELEQVRAEGETIWTKPWEDVYIFALAAARDWQHLEKIYDARPELMRNLCEYSRATVLAVSIVVALKNRGRDNEAAKLLDCFQKRLAREGSGPWSPAASQSYLLFANAQLLAIRGDRSVALRVLNQAVDDGWRGLGFSPKLSDYPALDPLRASADYSKIQGRLLRIIASQRAEILRQESESARRPVS